MAIDFYRIRLFPSAYAGITPSHPLPGRNLVLKFYVRYREETAVSLLRHLEELMEEEQVVLRCFLDRAVVLESVYPLLPPLPTTGRRGDIQVFTNLGLEDPHRKLYGFENYRYLIAYVEGIIQAKGEGFRKDIRCFCALLGT